VLRTGRGAGGGVSKKIWNRCDECGRFIALEDFVPFGKATRVMVLPDSWYSSETYETLCAKHARVASSAQSES